MGSLPLALSVHNFISSVGADAGFASIIGLAIVVLLYFAHARETSALREQAAELAARLQEAEAKLVQATRSGFAAGSPAPAAGQAQAAPAPATPAGALRAVATAAPVAAALASPPSAPAGVGAPALAAATRFVVPVSARVAPPASQTAPLAGQTAPPAPAPVSPVPAAAPAPAAAAPAQPPPAPAAAPAATAIPAPQTAAGLANGGGQRTAAPTSPPRPLPPRPAPRPSQSPLGSRRPYPPLKPPPRGRSRAARTVSLLVGALVVIGAVAALLIATSSSGTPSKSLAPRTSNAPGVSKRAAAFNPAAVTVAVLNGTATNNLAHTIAARLAADGYKEGRVATAADQTKTATTVGYLSGYRSDALRVASALKLSQSSVAPIDQTAQQVACPGTTRCTANVVVTVGADLATP